MKLLNCRETIILLVLLALFALTAWQVGLTIIREETRTQEDGKR